MTPRNLSAYHHLALLLLLILISWLFVSQLAEYLIASMYRGESLDSLNKLLTNRHTNSLEHYYVKIQGPILAVHIVLLIIGSIFLTRDWRRPSVFLALLVAGDVILVYFSSWESISLLDIKVDWSIPEFFQYFKELLTAYLLVILWRQTEERLYLVFAVIAVILFLDDALRYHEQIGHFLSPAVSATALPTVLKSPPNFIGEIISLAPLLLIVPIAAYLFVKTDSRTKVFAVIFCALLACLFLFGVVVDFAIHSDLTTNENLRLFLAWVEDFGEMIAMSLIATFAISRVWDGQESR